MCRVFLVTVPPYPLVGLGFKCRSFMEARGCDVGGLYMPQSSGLVGSVYKSSVSTAEIRDFSLFMSLRLDGIFFLVLYAEGR